MLRYSVRAIDGKELIAFSAPILQGYHTGRELLARYHELKEDDISFDEDEHTGRSLYIVAGEPIAYLERLGK